MPMRPRGACGERGCPYRAVRRGRCEVHAREAEARYRERHPDGRPSASARGYGADWASLRKEFLKAHPLCANQDGKRATHVDHILPRARGGTDDVNNLQALCHACHSRKTAMVDGGFGNRKRESDGRSSNAKKSV